jgi:hypothetical protein
VGRWCRVVSATDTYGRILGFTRPEPLLFLSSSSSIVFMRLSGPLPDSLLLRKSGSTGNQTRTSGAIARNSEHYITEPKNTTQKGKTIPVTGCAGPCETLRIPQCLDNRLTVNCEILATCSSIYSPVRTSQEAHSVSIK